MTLLSRACVSPYCYAIETVYLVPFLRYSASRNDVTLTIRLHKRKVCLSRFWNSDRNHNALQKNVFFPSAIVRQTPHSFSSLFDLIRWMSSGLTTRAREIVLVFTARRVCIARTVLWQDVRLSVRPSVRHTPVLSINGYTGAPNAKGYEKIAICDQYRALSRNWCKIEP